MLKGGETEHKNEQKTHNDTRIGDDGMITREIAFSCQQGSFYS
jgi:hypothetical protein